MAAAALRVSRGHVGLEAAARGFAGPHLRPCDGVQGEEGGRAARRLPRERRLRGGSACDRMRGEGREAAALGVLFSHLAWGGVGAEETARCAFTSPSSRSLTALTTCSSTYTSHKRSRAEDTRTQGVRAKSAKGTRSSLKRQIDEPVRVVATKSFFMRLKLSPSLGSQREMDRPYCQVGPQEAFLQ